MLPETMDWMLTAVPQSLRTSAVLAKPVGTGGPMSAIAASLTPLPPSKLFPLAPNPSITNANSVVSKRAHFCRVPK